nr:site-specific integrase [Fusobacterium gastrosuis]
MPVTKEKRGGEYTGRWLARFSYTDIMGVKHTVFKRGFETKREAQEYEREFLYNNSLTVNIPFKNMLAQYLEDKKQRVKASTFHHGYHSSILRLFDYFNDYLIVDITPAIIRIWQNEILLKTDLKDTTKRKINITLKAFFNWCVKYRGLKFNPMNMTDKIGKAIAKKELNILTLDELNLILQYIKKDEHRLLIKFLFWTGCRIGEALALTVDDIDLENKTININKTFSKIKREIIVTEPKTQESKRIISIPNKLNEELKEYMSKAIYIMEYKRIFKTDIQNIRRIFKRITIKHLNRDLTIHDLRHSHASLLINNGVEILAISKRLGHSNPTMTLNIYSHLYKSTEQRALDIINKLEE